MRGNFGIKLFYPKIRGHVLSPKFGLGREGLEFQGLLKKSKIFSKIG
jgi:hypothetical protein